jgi:hypothetical protein
MGPSEPLAILTFPPCFFRKNRLMNFLTFAWFYFSRGVGVPNIFDDYAEYVVIMYKNTLYIGFWRKNVFS